MKLLKIVMPIDLSMVFTIPSKFNRKSLLINFSRWKVVVQNNLYQAQDIFRKEKNKILRVPKIFTHTLLILSIILLSGSLASFAATTWTGNTSTDWGDPANWFGTPPSSSTLNTDVIIPSSPSGGKYPILSSGTYSIKKLTIQAGATLTQSGGYLTLNGWLDIEAGSPPGEYNQTDGTLQIKKNWQNEGVFNSTGGTVRFSLGITGGAFDLGSNQFFNIEIDDGVQPTFDNKIGNNIIIAGNIVNNNPNFDMTSKVTFTFNGSGDQTIYSVSTPLPDNTTFGNLVIDKPSGTIQLLSDVAVDLTFTEINGTLDVNGNTLWVSGSPTPVELSSFSAVIIENGIKLKWRTETEVNNYGFEVERQVGGWQTAVGNWELMGFVEGHGNSNSPKNYEFIDENILSGKYAYRLKQIDNDGTYEFSKVIEIDVDAPIGYELSQNYPNPFNPTTTIKFNLPESEVVNIVVYDILGTAVKTLVDEFKEAGIHIINFDASEFASGTYVYRIETSNYIAIKKMLLIK